MNWIKCSYELPEYDQDVLVIYYGELQVGNYDKKQKRWYTSNNGPSCDMCVAMENVTHWMPLPEKPNEMD